MSDTTTTDAPDPATVTAPVFQVHPVHDADRTRFAWRLRTGDGATCLTSGVRFAAREDARRDARRLKATAEKADIEDVTT